MILSTLWYNILITIIAAFLTAIVVVLIRRRGSIDLGVLCLIGIFAFWGAWKLTSTLTSRFSYTIIRVENAKKYSENHVIGTKSDKFFENIPNCEIEFEKTYIDNCSDRNIEIQSIEYGKPQIAFHVYPSNSLEQLIISHSSEECKVIPDYYFESPNSITIKKKIFSSSTDKVTKRILVYLGEDN